MKINTSALREVVFAIQFLELLLVSTLLIASFTLAGQLIYNNIFPFGFSEGMLFFAITTPLALILLATLKYFEFSNYSLAATMGKAMAAVLFLNLALIILLYFNSGLRLLSYYFFVTTAFQIAFLLLVKILSNRFKHHTLRNKIALIIGKNEDKWSLINAFRKQGIRRTVFISDDEEDLEKYMESADSIYLMSSPTRKIKYGIITYCQLHKKKLLFVPEIHEIALRDSEMMQVGDVPLFAIGGFKLTEAQMIVKRTMDIVLSIIAIILTSPILLVFAVLIMREDGGPVFFKQTRSGLNGKEFNVIKLRSMIVDAEKHTGAVLASEDDTRMTKIGHFIRAARIDEIPQFFNALSGSMSIVGPRPERPVFVEKYSKEYPEYSLRLTVKPGITGLAQVLANYATTVENKLEFDLIYIKKYSPAFDLLILIRTVKTVFTKHAAEGVMSEEKKRAIALEEHIAAENLLGNKKRNSIPGNYSVRKSALLLCLCFIVVISSVFMRYNSLALTIKDVSTGYNQTQAAQFNKDVDLTTAASKNSDIYVFASQTTTTPQAPKSGDHQTNWRDVVKVANLLLDNLSTENIIKLEEYGRDGFSANEIAEEKNILIGELGTDKLKMLNKLLANAYDLE